MRFFKQHSYEIVRLFLNQVALGVFGIVLFSATLVAGDGEYSYLTLLASIGSVLFYMYILFATMRELGAKDKIRIEGVGMNEDKNWGIKVALFSQIPNLFVLLLMVLGWFFAYVLHVGGFGLNLFSISYIIIGFLQAPYKGIQGAIVPVLETGGQCISCALLYLVSTLPAILVCWGGYRLGLCDKRKVKLQKPSEDDAE